MEVHNRWHGDITKVINSYQDTLSKPDQKKYKLDFLLRLTGRVAEFSAYCGECQLLQQEISTLTQNLSNLVYLPKPAAKAARKSYFGTIKQITQHLQKKHKLVTEGYYKGICMAIGPVIGVAIGAALGNPAAATGIGVAIGLAIGSYLDKKAQKEGRVI